MSNDLYTSTYNPDVLSCIPNLSNDEVFTPPEVANAMLDLLPQEFLLYLEEDGPKVVAADYIACMTDRFAIRTYEELFVPQSWKL